MALVVYIFLMVSKGKVILLILQQMKYMYVHMYSSSYFSPSKVAVQLNDLKSTYAVF